jgi:hypothetical protein
MGFWRILGKVGGKRANPKKKDKADARNHRRKKVGGEAYKEVFALSNLNSEWRERRRCLCSNCQSRPHFPNPLKPQWGW